MEFNSFKDKLFELINDAENFEINDIETDDKGNTFTIITQTGFTFELVCRQVAS